MEKLEIWNEGCLQKEENLLCDKVMYKYWALSGITIKQRILDRTSGDAREEGGN